MSVGLASIVHFSSTPSKTSSSIILAANVSKVCISGLVVATSLKAKRSTTTETTPPAKNSIHSYFFTQKAIMLTIYSIIKQLQNCRIISEVLLTEHYKSIVERIIQFNHSFYSSCFSHHILDSIHLVGRQGDDSCQN